MLSEDSNAPAANNSNNNAAAADDSLKLRHYWHVVLERRWLIISTFTLVFFASAVYAFKALPIFQAKARLQIDREVGILQMGNSFVYDPREQDYLQTQYRNLTSRSLVDDVIHKLKLDQDDRYRREIDISKAVMEDIDIVPIRLTRLVDIKVLHPNPTKAAEMANTLVETFQSQNIVRKQNKAMDSLRLLRGEAQAQETQYFDALRNLNRYKVEKRMASLQPDQNIIRESLRNQRDIVDRARVEYMARQKESEKARAWVEDGKPPSDLSYMNTDDVVRNLRNRLNQREADLKAFLTRYGEKHPRIIELRSALAQDREQLQSEATRAYQIILADAELAKAKWEKSQQDLDDQETEIGKFNAAQLDYEVLYQKAERERVMFQQVLAKAKEVDLNTKDTVQNMTIIDRANPPVKPIKPDKVLVLLAGLFGGLATALGLAFFVNYLDDSIKSQEDVENYLRVAFLGYIPNIKSASVVERDLQSHLHPTSSPAEGFRSLRAAVSLARNADKLRVIAVTSTIPSEGKSLVASNFAIVTAQTGLRTLLIDADLRRPSVHKAFQLQSPVGLSSYLAERVNNVSEFIHSTDVPNLDVVCCGATPNNPSELIGSKRMLQFLEEVSARYDRVVLDCPPVSAVADPLIVGAMCDGMVFVTKFNKIRREHALRSIQRLQDAGIHLIGVILNDIDFEGKDSYYYSYHYYQNRYYATHYRGNKSGADGKKNAEKAPAEKKPAGKNA